MATADQLITFLQGMGASTLATEADRVRVRDALLDALMKVQSPWELAWDHNWTSGATIAAIKTLIDAGVFTKWAATGGDPITCAKLAELTGADEVLTRRMMRCIAGQRLVTEVAEDTYARTPWAVTLAEDKAFPSLYGGFYHDLNNPMFRALPAYLKHNGFRNPTNPNDCNFQFWQGDKGADFFRYVGNTLQGDFNNAMECHSKYNLTPWTDVYPTDTVVAAARAGSPLVVDVGGGKGHDLQKFLARHPEACQAAGSLVLQDRDDILKGVEAELDTPAIKVHPHDFFTEQPVKGAKVYFMHNVLHDWSDDQALDILRKLAVGMEKGYSKLLIHESLVSNIKPLSRVTVSDLTMMACLGAAERTEEQWRELVAAVPLKLVKIWRPPQSVESIIEVEVA